MRAYTPTDAEAAVRRALAGLGTAEDAEILVDLFRRASGKKADRDAASRALAFEREANALAAVLADIIEAAVATPYAAICDRYIDDLPHDARRRVLAYRHKLGPWSRLAATDARFGPLPRVPPRDSVMRDRVRTIDVDPPEDEPDSPRSAVRDAAAEGRMIEGTVVSVRDEP